MDLDSEITRLAPRVIAYCVACSGDTTDGQEAAQEALAALVARVRRHGPPHNVDAFVFAVARRRAAKARFKRKLFQPFVDDDGHSPEPRSDEAAEHRDQLRWTLRALAALSSRDRQALLLVALGELSIADAARTLGVSNSAMKMRVSRARRRLVAALEGGCSD
jgi:RNA polymerase sigma-70 factor (ECF subfamily)